MTDEELKNKCKERAKIFQQAKESCKSSSPMDCIEWFADRIAELEKENAEAKEIINAFLDFEASAMERGCYIADDTRRRAEDFIKEQV